MTLTTKKLENNYKDSMIKNLNIQNVKHLDIILFGMKKIVMDVLDTLISNLMSMDTLKMALELQIVDINPKSTRTKIKLNHALSN